MQKEGNRSELLRQARRYPAPPDRAAALAVMAFRVFAALSLVAMLVIALVQG